MEIKDDMKMLIEDIYFDGSMNRNTGFLKHWLPAYAEAMYQISKGVTYSDELVNECKRKIDGKSSAN